ncbi:hypothetical protein QFZ47_001327 [Variovorax paradoxus]|nr:hypothetical protein [Variovorax paradoxus]
MTTTIKQFLPSEIRGFGVMACTIEIWQPVQKEAGGPRQD